MTHVKHAAHRLRQWSPKRDRSVSAAAPCIDLLHVALTGDGLEGNGRFAVAVVNAARAAAHVSILADQHGVGAGTEECVGAAEH